MREQTGKKRFLRMIAFGLVFILLSEAIPAAAAADLLRSALREDSYINSAENGVIPAEITEEPSEAAASEPYVLGEDESLRDEYTKYFRLSDGSYAAAAYEEAVHYLDGTGSWKEIDNRLADSASADDGFSGLENRQNNVKIKFAKKSNSRYLYRIKDGSYSIYVGADQKGAAPVYSVSAVLRQSGAEEDAPEKRSVNEAASLRKNIAAVTYPGLWENTDLEYVVNGTSVKENIIIQKAGGDYRYSFTIKLKNLVPVMQEDGSIGLDDAKSGKQIFLIPAPYLYDAAGAVSDAAAYTITPENGKNHYTLTILADADWIENEARVFPVTLDPILVKDGLRTQVRDTFVKEGSPNQIAPNGADILYLGYDSLSTERRRRVYTKYNSLPELPSSAIVTQALLYYYQMPASSPGYSGTDGLAVTAREVLGSWDSATIKWNNQPSFSSTVLDYIIAGSNTNGTFLTWDITSAVQKWYAGSANNGVILMPDTERTASSSAGVNANVRLASSDNANLNYMPALLISYRDSKGLEDYWTYEAFELGDAGTAYVNVFNRNLTFVHNLYQTPGNILPINVSIIYNSSLAGKWGSDLCPVNGSTLWAGSGNKLNVYEKMYEKTISSRLYYIHEDADGTEHYYYDRNNNGKFVSEDGLDATITKSGSTYTMTNPDGLTKVFNSQGNISYIKDKYGNYKYFNYTSQGYITGISEQNAGSTTRKQLVTFTNDGNVSLQISGAPSGTDKYTLGYYIGKMTSITHYSRNSGSEAWEDQIWIEYDEAHNSRLSFVHSIKNDVKLIFSYDSQNRLTQIETQKSGTCVGKVGISDYGDKTVRFRSWGKDEIYGNGDDLYTVYTCDNYGRAICSYVTDLSGTVLGAAAAKYNDAEGTKKHNTVAESSVKNATSKNLFLYSNFEEDSNTNPIHDHAFNETNAWMYYTTEKAYLGKRSLKIDVPDDDVNLAYTSVNLSGGKTYCFSTYVNTADMSGDFYFYLYDSAANAELARVYVPEGSTDASIENGWRRIFLTADISTTGVYYLWMAFSGSGTVYLDCMQFEEASAPGRYNMMEWTSFGNGQYATNSTYSESGYPIAKGWKLNGSPKQITFFSQEIEINRPGTDTYMLSFWAQSNSVRLGTDPTRSSCKRTFEVHAEIFYTDGTNELKRAEVNPQNRSRQLITMPIIPNANKTVDYITIYGVYNYNANVSYVGDFTLTLEPAQAYTYDGEGNVKTVQTATGDSLLTYAANNLDLSKEELPNGDEYTYTYKSSPSGIKADIASVTNKNHVKVSYQYDQYGNITKISANNTAGSKTYVNRYEYGDNGNYLTVQKDARLKSTTYTYNYNNGLLQRIVDAGGNATSYLYNSQGKVEQIFNDLNQNGARESSEAYAQYAYSGNLLTSLNKGNLQYGFLHDSLGNLSQVKITGRESALASYTYSTAGGYLTKLTYGNGDFTEYTYDSLGRLTAVYNDGVKTCEYRYNKNGALYSVIDLENGITTSVDYDSLGRTIRLYESDADGAVLSLENQYDAYGRGIQSTYLYNGQARTYSLLYKANSDLIESISLPNGAKAFYTYDYLERVSGKTVKTGENGTVLAGTAYEYSIGYEPGITSSLIQKVSLDVSDNEYTYVYDNRNNITQIRKNGQIIRKYTYDSLNQMTSEILLAPGASTGKKYTYTYDLYGNLLSKKEENYTASTEATSNASTKQYTYGDSTWKDLLTACGNLTYTYDEIGNLTSTTNTGTGEVTAYSWERGRRLERIEKGTSITEYTYNADGIRIGKSVPGGTLRYLTDGTRLVSQIGTGVGKTLDFYYNAGGEAIGFRYGGADYYYGRNVQGDVIELYQSGALIATYEYDAWGKLVSVKNASGAEIADTLESTHAAAVNPIRYRGYYYDHETGYYYLNSRYYDPEVGRFINADGYVSTGQGILGTNMFAYCENNPVSRVDPTGHFWSEIWEFAKTAVTEIGKAIGVLSPAYAGCGGAAVADGPLPFGDIVAAAGAALLTVGAIGYGIYQATQAPAISVPKVEEKSEAIVIPKEPDSPVIFPVDPNTFNPVGLVKVPRAGTKNGAFISWMDPLTNTEVFRWDENPNYSNGPHYHIHGTGHYYPGMIVPEPYATIYFPFR